MNRFGLIDAQSAADAAALLHAYAPHAQHIAAGGDLLGLLKEGVEGPTLRAPATLINLATAVDMVGITRVAGGWRLGAMTNLARFAAHPELAPMISQAVARIASPQLRARTTLGGNLLQRPRCLYFRHPDLMCFKKGGSGCPASAGPPDAYPGALFPDTCHSGHPSDLAPVLIALDACAEIVAPSSMRMVPLIDLYEGAGTNPKSEARLAANEVLAAIRMPDSNRAQAFEKVAPRDANEFSWACAAVVLSLQNRAIVRARVALGGISPAPMLWSDANEILVNRRIDDINLDIDSIVEQILPDSPITERHRARAAACRTAIHRALSRIVGLA